MSTTTIGGEGIAYGEIDTAVGQNWYDLDPTLQAQVQADCPPMDLDWANDTLRSFGALVGNDIARNADLIDANSATLTRYGRWADELNEVQHPAATIDSKSKLWASGYVSGFAEQSEKRRRPTPGVVVAASNYLLSQADTGLVCSLGMTMGVAMLVGAYAPPDVRDQLLPRLLASDLEKGADGSMFLTERDGGSDLGRTVRCTATDIGDGRVLLNGEKWFCSNIDGEATVLLARPEGATDGAAGIGLYLLPRHLEDGSRNTYSMRRLKPKLGTRSVPTGEVEFHDALGYALRSRSSDGTQPASDAGGLNRMMEMVNMSRFGVAMMGLGIARRAFLESMVWAHHREAKGRLLVDLPLVREQLVDLHVEIEAAMALGFDSARPALDDRSVRLRRMLIPAAKIRLCRLGVEAANFNVELYGGNGYCEDWGQTRLLRDAVCHPIWEGSENICALDVLRAVRRERSDEAALSRIDAALEAATDGPDFLREAVDAVSAARDELARRAAAVDTVETDWTHAHASRFTDLVTRTVQGALLCERGVDDPRAALVALRYARRRLLPDAPWSDRIAFTAGARMLRWAEIDDSFAAEAALPAA